MKIVAPIANLEEIEPLSSVGANEFYCGFIPDGWVAKFRAPNLNRCLSGNFRSHAELNQAVRLAHQNACSIALVLNAQSDTDEQGNALLSIANSFLDMGGDALIVSDLGLVAELYEHVPPRRIHVSSVATCRNHSAASFCKELGASRLILPRDVTIGEACEIAGEVPGLEVETFVLNEGGVFEDGACATLHLPPHQRGPICVDSYANHYRRRGSGDLNKAFLGMPVDNDQEYRQWLWYCFSCGFKTNEAGMPFGLCGLCALPALMRGGVAAVKIAGRESPTARKLASVRMVRAVLDRIEAGECNEQVMRFAQELRPSLEYCKKGCMCYYPEVIKH